MSRCSISLYGAMIEGFLLILCAVAIAVLLAFARDRSQQAYYRRVLKKRKRK